MFDWLSNWFNKPMGLDIVDMTWEPGTQIKENTLKIYVIKYKNEINSAHISEYDARDSYRYSRATLAQDMHLYEIELTDDMMSEIPRESSENLEIAIQRNAETTPSQ